MNIFELLTLEKLIHTLGACHHEIFSGSVISSKPIAYTNQKTFLLGQHP
jgi:hypothetical protein